MAVLTYARNASLIVLVLIVLRGVILYDNRFTIFLLPPFLVYYTATTPGWFTQLPLVQFLDRMRMHTENAYGLWPFRLFMVSLGLMGGAYIGELFGGK